MNTRLTFCRVALIALAAVFINLALAGCGSTAPAETAIVSTSGPTSFEATATSRAATSIAAPPTATQPAPPTLTAVPTDTAEPPPPDSTPTPEGGVVPTPEVALDIDLEAQPAPFDDVPHPGYAASTCSDKYPCNDDFDGWVERMRVPEGFAVDVYGRIDGQPNVLTFGPDGLLYIGTMSGEIFTMDADGKTELYVDGFIAPAGLAFQPGTDRLYVSSRVVDQNEGGEAQVAVVEEGEVRPLITGLPCCYVAMHSANGIDFGPDGYGYVAVGARADHGEILSGPQMGEQDVLHPLEASILRFSPDGTVVEPYARGFRNAYDIAWDGDGRLYATDNMPDFGPPEEFNKVVAGGEHGYPWYDCEVCFAAPEGVEIVPPIYEFVAHSAPTGVTAYLDDAFPGFYNSLFVTLWSAFEGAQKVVWFAPGGEGDVSDFATGFAAPIDLTVGPDGALYVADWATGLIFRIWYEG
jgi:sugar lactone lactonase YvrE